jgi:hypothetical protein
MNFLKKVIPFSNSEIDTIVSWDLVPVSLRKLFFSIRLYAITVFVISIFFFFNKIDFAFYSVGLLISLCLFIYSYYLRYRFSRNKFVRIDGTCIDIRYSSWTRRYRNIFFQTEDGSIYCYVKSQMAKSYIKVGDAISVFACDDFSIRKNNDYYIISQYYVAGKTIS